MDETKDIEGLIAEYEDNHSGWLDQMDDDFKLFTLASYQLDKDSTNITSNGPRVFADKIIQTLEAADMLLIVTTPDEKGLKFDEKAPVPFLDEPSRNKEKENAVERLCYGFRGMADRRLRRTKIIHGRTVQSAQWFYGAIRGAMCQRMLFLDDDGKRVPDILPIDPRYFSYGIDKDGMEWCAPYSWRDPDTIYDEYNVRVDEITKVIDYWDTKTNIIQIGAGDKAHTKKQKHKLGRVPFIFRPVGSVPLVYGGEDDGSEGKINRYGHIEVGCESIYAGSRDMYDVKNMILTIWASLLKKSHKRSCFIITPAGKLPLEKVPWGEDKVVPLPLDSKVEWINPPDIAMTAPKFYEIIDREIQKADLATIEYGMITGADAPSGKSILALQGGRDSKITPLLKTAEALWEDTFEYLCEQYEKKGSKMTVRGYDSKGKLFYQDIKPSDVKKPWNIEVKFVSITPEQETQNIAKAQMLLSSGLPDEYVYENALQMQDPDKPRRQKLLQELENTNPIIKALHQLEALQREGHKKESQVVALQLQQMIGQLATQQAATPPQNPAEQSEVAPPQERMIPPQGAPDA